MSDAAHTLAGILSVIQAGRGVDDPELARRLDEAFSKHTETLHRYVRKELRGMPDERVEEVVQDVLVEAWVKLPTYRPDDRFRAFLWGIASFKCKNVRRKRADVLAEDGWVDDVGDPSEGALARLADQERDDLIQRAAQGVLDATDQDLVHLRWVLDYSLDEVAERLELSSGNEVRVRLQRCKRRMQTEIRRLVLDLDASDSFLGLDRPRSP